MRRISTRLKTGGREFRILCGGRVIVSCVHHGRTSESRAIVVVARTPQRDTINVEDCGSPCINHLVLAVPIQRLVRQRFQLINELLGWKRWTRRRARGGTVRRGDVSIDSRHQVPAVPQGTTTIPSWTLWEITPFAFGGSGRRLRLRVSGHVDAFD